MRFAGPLLVLSCLTVLTSIISGDPVGPRVAQGQLHRTLNEEKRKAIYLDIVRAQDRARREAGKRYSEPLPHDRAAYMDWYDKREAYVKILRAKYEGAVAEKFGISVKDLNEVLHEGNGKFWPFPSP